MPSQTRPPTSTTTTTTPQTTTTSTTPSLTTTPNTTGPQSTSDNSFLSALLTGAEKVDGEAWDYFAQGIMFQRGMKGELIKRVQQACGLAQDGGFGPKTEAALRLFQKAKGLPETGVVDQVTWGAVCAETASLKNLKGEEDFARMWENHPHNYQADESQNTTSDALVAQLGMQEGSVPNTCALRMSTMMNRMGGDMGLTTNKGKQAGLDKMRAGGLYMPSVKDPNTKSTNDKVIVSAKEMWTYIEKHRGKPDLVFPPKNRYKTQEEAEQGAKDAEAAVQGKKGMVAFDKIFGYGGSGHVDLFDGSQLSDGSWYPSEAIKIWFIVQ